MSTDAVTPLRQRMIEDMNARKLGAHSQRSHIHSCRRFAAFLKRSPDTAAPDDVRRFQLHLAETGMSICNRNRIMTGVKFLFRVTLRRPDLAAEIYHLREPQKIPLVMSQDETRRRVNRGNAVPRRKRGHLRRQRDDSDVRRNNKTTVRMLCQIGDGTFDVRNPVNGKNDGLKAKLRRDRVKRTPIHGANGIIRIVDHSDARDPWGQLPSATGSARSARPPRPVPRMTA